MAGPPRRPAEVSYAPFLLAALLFGTLGGFTLAVSLPVKAALGGLDTGWLAHAQMHGHLQVVGFAGLFMAGVALHLAPRFGGQPPALAGWARPMFALLAGGLLLRAVGQPLAGYAPFSGMLVAGALAELAGAVLFAAMLSGTLRPALRARAPHAWLLACASGWFVVQAALGAWWLTALAVEGRTVLISTHNTVLVNAQLFGMLLSAILGVGLRAFPTFFGMPPVPARTGVAVAVLSQGGMVAWTAGGIAGLELLAHTGQAMVGSAILLAVATFGFWRRRHRLAPASSGHIRAIQPASLWLTLTGAGLAWGGARALATGSPPSLGEADAVRHVFAVGVVTLAIVGMAQLILPEFASERLVARPSRWRGPAFGAALSLAVVLRGLLPWAGIEAPARFWLMSAAGALGLGAVSAFAFLYVRALRRHRAYLARITALRTREIAIETLDP